MVLGPASSASVAVAWFSCLFAGGLWHARKQIPSELATTTTAISVPVAVSENARFAVEGNLEKPVIIEQEIKEMLEQAVISDQADSDSSPNAASSTDMIDSKTVELVDEVIQNRTSAFAAFGANERKLLQFAVLEYDFASFSLEEVKHTIMKVFDNSHIHTSLINALSLDSSKFVWAIVASLPIDLFLIFCMCGCCRNANVTTRDEPATASEGRTTADIQVSGTEQKNLTSPAEQVSAETVRRTKQKSQRDLKALLERKRAECEVVENTQTEVLTDAKAPEQPKFTWHRLREPEDQSNGQMRAQCRNSSDLKALMEKKRDQCQVLESAQEHVETDAKAPEQPKFTWHRLCEPEDQRNGHVRAQCRNSSDLKALMEKKRDQCQVLESAQEHVETDAKASCHDVPDKQRQGGFVSGALGGA